MKIFAFGHRKQVGKDTMVNGIMALLQKDGYWVRKAAFAEPVYEICHTLYGHLGFGTKKFYDRYPERKSEVLPKIGKTPREVLINMGTVVKSHVWEDTWSTLLLRRNAEVMLISDLRFPYEVEAIRERGGKCYKVDRPFTTISNDTADDALGTHTDWDRVFINDCSIPDLIQKGYKEICSVLQNS